jgi:hypothetical protein
MFQTASWVVFLLSFLFRFLFSVLNMFVASRVPYCSLRIMIDIEGAMSWFIISFLREFHIVARALPDISYGLAISLDIPSVEEGGILLVQVISTCLRGALEERGGGGSTPRRPHNVLIFDTARWRELFPPLLLLYPKTEASASNKCGQRLVVFA